MARAEDKERVREAYRQASEYYDFGESRSPRPPPLPSRRTPQLATAVSSTGDQQPAALTVSASSTENPARKRTWIWAVVVGAVIVGVAVGLGVGLGTQVHPPRATYGTVSF